jgi:peptide/nickel transport system permease protein
MLVLLHSAVFATFDLLPEATYTRLGAAAIEKRTLEETRRQLGLDGTLLDRYTQSVVNLMRCDLGRSVQSNYPVSRLLVDRLWVSAPLIIASLIVAASVMIWAAQWFCSPELNLPQRILLALSPAALVPQFASASTFAVAGTLIFSASSIGGLAHEIINETLLVLSVAILPSGLLFMAAARSAQMSVGRRFVVTYRAMGFSWWKIRQVLQANILAEMLPLCNRVALAVVTGTLFAELSFNRPGIGAVLAEAIRAGDQPVASGWMLMVAAPIIIISQIASALAVRLPPT